MSSDSYQGLGVPISNWTVDYGFGRKEVEIPHVWHLDCPVDWEGPAIYRCTIAVPAGDPHLVFQGVSYAADIRVNGELILSHHGIWNAFTIQLSRWIHKTVEISLTVTKNGGATYPVKQVASGFIPYVFQTFGGIFRPVMLVDGCPNAEPLAHHRVSVSDGHLYVDQARFFARGILTWGWYPETANPHQRLDVIRGEVERIKLAGFNLVKFCLWMPSHEYLDELDSQGLMAWLELPIWLPATDSDSLQRMKGECLRIVNQYRHHPNILAWTAGCELSEGIDPEWRKELVKEIHNITGHPMIKDNSGGAEMYGGHPEEFGTFDDFHPYCEPAFYPLVLGSLSHGPRTVRPTLLGEFNDYDVFRPIQRWRSDPPYWASPDPDLNDKGVRWQFDFPKLLAEFDTSGSDLANWLEARSERLEASSKSQGAWLRQTAFDATRLELDSDGWVLTGHRHTPISSAGIVDDEGQLVYPIETTQSWNEDVALLLFPRRTPPWIHGGNRPGWEHATVRFAGPCLFQVAVHSAASLTERLEWTIEDAQSIQIGSGAESLHSITACVATEVGRFSVNLEPGFYRLSLRFGPSERRYSIQVFSKLGDEETFQVLDQTENWGIASDTESDFWIGSGQATSGPGLRFAPPSGSIAKPMFRECCYSWDDEEWAGSGWRDNWALLNLIFGDRVLDGNWLDREYPGWTPMLTRLDTRTFERHAVLARCGDATITTIRPQGGLGIQPIGIHRNPAGVAFMRSIRGSRD